MGVALSSGPGGPAGCLSAMKEGGGDLRVPLETPVVPQVPAPPI